MTIFNVITLFGGLAMFLYGMEIMGNGLKNSSGEALRRALSKVTQNPVMGVLTGTLVTAVIQSSMATIVLAVGLVGVGILSLRQAVNIVLGANIGTTITGQIIRLMDLNSSGNAVLEFFKPGTLAPVALIIGVILIMFIHNHTANITGEILVGFGILFIGLLNMTGAVEPLADSPVFLDLICKFGDTPIISILLGLIITMIVQSSSATVGMIQALSATGVLTFNVIYPLIMGIDLGTCVTTAIVCSIGSSRDAKRIGIVHIAFNVIGTVAFMIAMTIMRRAGLFQNMWTMVVNSGHIANFQTFFKLVTAILLLPFTSSLMKLSKLIIKPTAEEEEEEDFPEMSVLDEKLYISPSIALDRVGAAIADMGALAQKNLGRAFKQLETYSHERSDKINAAEDRVDSFTDGAENYLIKLSRLVKKSDDNIRLNVLLQALTDFERISDYATNINKLGGRLNSDNIGFSASAKKELGIIKNAVEEIVSLTVKAFKEEGVETARLVEPLEEVVDDIVATLKEKHTQRLKDGKCTIEAGLVFMEVVTNAGRAADQCSSIAVFLLGQDDPSILDSHHAYLKELHKGEDPFYYAEYKKKYREYMNEING